jgi:glycine/D-amino acid oxidase-like deaminating enzyme
MHYDVIVIGMGAFGAATLCQLAQRGVRVAGLTGFRRRMIRAPAMATHALRGRR